MPNGKAGKATTWGAVAAAAFGWYQAYSENNAYQMAVETLTKQSTLYAKTCEARVNEIKEICCDQEEP